MMVSATFWFSADNLNGMSGLLYDELRCCARCRRTKESAWILSRGGMTARSRNASRWSTHDHESVGSLAGGRGKAASLPCDCASDVLHHPVHEWVLLWRVRRRVGRSGGDVRVVTSGEDDLRRANRHRRLSSSRSHRVCRRVETTHVFRSCSRLATGDSRRARSNAHAARALLCDASLAPIRRLLDLRVSATGGCRFDLLLAISAARRLTVHSAHEACGCPLPSPVSASGNRST